MLGRELMTARIHWVGKLGGTLDVLTDIEWTIARMLVPPLDEGLIIGSSVAYLPIELRHAVVDETIIDPEQHIGIEVIIVLKTEGL